MINYHFSDNISEREKHDIIDWIQSEHPTTHTHIKIGRFEYVLVVVLDEYNNVAGYSIQKPTKINIFEYK